MRKILHALFTIILVLVFSESRGQITVGTVDPGPYTPGSTIAATFTLGAACIAPANTFELYLSDSNGNFANEVRIGTYATFYSAFVNGIIPAGTPAGTGYQIRLKSTNPATTSAASGPIIITAGTTPVEARLTSAQTTTIGSNPVTFGNCNTDENVLTTRYTFTNASTAAAVTVTIVNQIDGGAPTILTFTSIGQALTYTATLAHFTMFVRAVMPDGSVGTRAYFLINNVSRTAFTTTTGNTVCFPTGSFEYLVNVSPADGIGRNFPGNIYRIDWGDGSASDYTICDITSNSNRVGHTFVRSSCGLSYTSGTQTIYNAFGVNVNVVSPFCGNIGAPLSTPARVVSRPENRFSFPPVACLNDNVIFVNNSLPGQRSNTNSVGCADNNVLYTWYVDGAIVAQDEPLSYSLQHVFTVKGQHIVRLSSSSDGGCQADDIEFPICIQDPPAPSFTLPATTLCLTSATLTPTNTSVIDNTCPNVAPPVYTWAVTPPSGVTYNVNSITPTFTFTQIGVYNITLNIQSATCNRTTAPQEVVVNSTPQTTMSPDARLCSQGGEFSFGPNGGVTQTTTTGTAKPLTDTYTWTVTGGTNYSFDPSTPPTSQYPKITFTDYGTYTVTLVHKNNCNPTGITTSQTLTFLPSPSPTVTVAPTVCYGAQINLQAVINNSNPSTSFTWSSSGNGTFSDPNSLTPIYTPSAADLNALSTTITLLVNTGIPGECEFVRAIKTVTILPNNTGTNTIQNICTGGTLVYTPSSSVASSIFRWTAVNADGNAQPGTYPTSGNGDINASSIINTNATAAAQIIYTITPVSTNGVITCDGVPYTLTVNVNPLPVLTATAAQPVICSDNPAGITLTSNLGPATTYTWSTSVTGGSVLGAPSQTTPIATTSINNNLSNQGTTSATLTYVITPYSASGCPGTPVSVSVQVDPALTTPNAGQDENICNSSSFVLKGNPIIAGTGTWTLTSAQSGVTFTDDHAYNTTVSGLVPGQNYVFQWTVTGGICGALSDDMSLYVNIPTVPGTTSTNAVLPVCEAANTGTITLAGNLGAVTRWQSSVDGGASWTDIVNTSNTLTYNNLTVTTQFRAGVKNGDCLEEFSTGTTITVVPATTIANAGNDQALCAETSVQLNALSALKTGETGLWTVSPTLPNTVIVNPNNTTTQVTGLAPGQVYTFTWTITGPSPCGPTRDDVVITNLLPLTNTITSTSTVVCFNQIISITGDTPSGGNGTYTYRWEASSDGTVWSNINGQTAKDLSYQLQATLSFRRIVNSSTCTAISNVIRIIAQPPIANNTISADQPICTGVVPAALTGTVPTGSDGNFNYQWQSSPNGSSWTDINGAVFEGYAPPALTATTLYRRIVSTITCNGDLRSISNRVTITVRPNAEAEFTYTQDQSCAPFIINAGNIRAVPYPDRNASYSWYANNELIGTGITFPGYTITASNTVVTIKLVTAPSNGCQPDEMSHDFSTTQSVTPAFTQSAASGCGPLVVSFVNTSTSLEGATFRWDFGNGVTSSQTMPAAVTFQPDPTGKDTTYTVRLTSITPCGTSSVTSTVFIKAKPISIFSPSRTVGCSPMTVTFTNTSPGSTNTYYYDFGDGTLLTKTDKSPVTHTFITTIVRDFTVKMVSENECGRDESSYTIRVSPNTVLPELVVNANEQTGCAPFTVNFYNNSRGANLFRYDFGDGSTPTITRTAPEVVRHTFTSAGTYTITLTASNGCSDTTTTEQVTVLPAPVTGFTADITLGCPGLAVQFRNTSVDGVSYLWDFGDGTTSAEFQPRHVFTAAQEFYTVSLTSTNSLGCTSTTTMNQYIRIVAPPTALFNVAPSTLISIPDYTFRFEDESTNNPTIWAWDFGDGTTSTLQNPSHTYPDTGKYVVTLRVSNQQGCFTTTFKTVTIVGVPGYLYVPNSFMPGSQTPELRTFIAKGSGIKSWRFNIFNKWGQTLWETTQLNEGRPVDGWDGTFNGILQPQGVYFWKIDVEFVNGSEWKGMTYDSSAPKKTGVIHLIR
jgi:PKD repeat protein